MPKVFIGVGSNLGDRTSYFQLAKKCLEAHSQIRNLRYSDIYETEPVNAKGGRFLNAVWSFETDLGPKDVLAELQRVEQKSGRVRNSKNDARTLDLDLLAYGDEQIGEKGLEVPHPRMQERLFVLRPFCDLDPDWTHPKLKKSAKRLYEELNRKAKCE